MSEYSWVFTITFWNYIALIINIISYVFLSKRAKHSNVLKAFFKVQLFMIIWIVGKILKTVAPTLELKWIIVKIYYIGIYFSSISFFEFSYIYYKKENLNFKFKIFLYSIGIVEYLIVITNRFHYMFYTYFDFEGDSFGILFYTSAIINYIIILFGIVLCYKKIKKDELKLKKIIIISIVLPFILNIMYISTLLEYVFDILHFQIFDITPVVYSWVLLVFLYATIKYEFFDLSHIIKNDIIMKLDTAFIVIDNKYNILYSNDKYNEVFNDFNPLDIKGNTGIIEYKNKFYNLISNTVYDVKDKKKIILLNDITILEQSKLQLVEKSNELKEINKKLDFKIDKLIKASKINAKNYVLRDIHDIIGHSLVVIMKLLEVVRIYYKTDTEKAIHTIDVAYDCINDSYNDIYNINRSYEGLYNSSFLKKEINNILDITKISELEVKFYSAGSLDFIEEKVINAIKKIITESITNTLKHSDANRILLNIIFNKKYIKISIIDNGRGCEDIKKGNGLKGVEERLMELNATLEIYSNKNEGFSIQILIPISD